MEDELHTGAAILTASQTAAAEATFSKQCEDHTLPARQVFGEQRDDPTNGCANCVFIP